MVPLLDSVGRASTLAEWLVAHPTDSIRYFDALNYQPNASGGANFESGIWCAVAVLDAGTDSTYDVREAYFYPPAHLAGSDLPGVETTPTRARQECTLGMLWIGLTVGGDSSGLQVRDALAHRWEGRAGSRKYSGRDEPPFLFGIEAAAGFAVGNERLGVWPVLMGVGADANPPWFGELPDQDERTRSAGRRAFAGLPARAFVSAVALRHDRGVGTLVPGSEFGSERPAHDVRALRGAFLADPAVPSDVRAIVARLVRQSGQGDSDRGPRPVGVGFFGALDSLLARYGADSVDRAATGLAIHLVVQDQFGLTGAELPWRDSAFVKGLDSRKIGVDWDHYNDGYYYFGGWADSAVRHWRAPGAIADSLFAWRVEGRGNCDIEMQGGMGSDRVDGPAWLISLRRWIGLVGPRMNGRLELELAKAWSDELAWAHFEGRAQDVGPARDSAVAHYRLALRAGGIDGADEAVWPEAWNLSAGMLPTRVWNYCSTGD